MTRPSGKWLNGWRRLWVAATLTGLICGWVFIFFLLANSGDAQYQQLKYDEALEADFSNGNCDDYIHKPMKELTEPGYSNNGGNCWHIYTSRLSDKGHTAPYTRAQHHAYEAANWWEEFWSGFIAVSILVFLVSALTYLAGVTIAWIRKGFQEP